MTAKHWYEKTRTLRAFSVTDKHTVRRNQHASVYTFSDGSRFIAYGKRNEWHGACAWRDANGNTYARRISN